LKLAAGWHTATLLKSRYLERLVELQLDSFAAGQAMRKRLAASPPQWTAAESAALAWVESLTRTPGAGHEAAFRALRPHWNDAQILELTLAVCYYNYLARLAAALGLTPEPTVPVGTVPAPEGAPPARVAAVSQDELVVAAEALAAAPVTELPASLGQAMRTMARVPRQASAWKDHWNAFARYSNASRELKLLVALAVSHLNSDPYSTAYQVAALERQGSTPARMAAAREAGSGLNPAERAALGFARKLTRSPAEVAPSELGGLKAVFGEEGALEIVMQACIYNFMNRFAAAMQLTPETAEAAPRLPPPAAGTDAPRP
jgi:alkylhydroperoxidase family enzyme